MVFGLFGKRDKGAGESRDMVAVPKPQHASVEDTPRLERLGPILWQDIRFDMSLGDVSKLYPQAVRPTDDNRLGDGTIAELEIPLLRLSDHDFRVLIYARLGRVTQVTIASIGKPEHHDFRQLVGALRLRYGQEVELNDNLEGFSTAEWLSNEGTNVSLVCYPEIDCLNIVFQNRYSDSARQL